MYHLIYLTNQIILGIDLEKQTNHTRMRKWNADYHNTPLDGSPIKRKPDIILVDHSGKEDARMPRWPNVRAICEITATKNFHARIRYTIWSKAFIMMNTQFNRIFIPFLSICGERFWLNVCDRAGVIQSIEYNLHDNALVFLRVLVGFMFGNESVLGRDTTMRLGADDEVVGITVGGQEYTVVKKIFSSETLRGWGTQCWHVRHDGQDYVIKDSWIHTGWKHSETEMLEIIRGIPCVPTINHGEDLQLPGGIPSSTNVVRVGLDSPEERIHRRILLQPVGESIFTFTSKKELIGVFIDIIKGMYL
jgi:Fungal protein kinase